MARIMTLAIWSAILAMALSPILWAALAEPQITRMTASEFNRQW